MGNSQTKHTIIRQSPHKYSDTPSLRAVCKSATTGFLNEKSLHLPDDLCPESEQNSLSHDANFKRYSCFSFSPCQESQREYTAKPSLFHDDNLDTWHSSGIPVKMRESSSRALLKSTSGLFTKVRQRLVNFNRRSHPVNLNPDAVFEPLPNANRMRLSVTDYNIERMEESGDMVDLDSVQDENLLKKRKFGGRLEVAKSKFTKSPAMYDIHGIGEEGADMAKKISDLFEVKEDEYDEYENDTYEGNDYNNNHGRSESDSFMFRRRQFKPAHSLGDSTSSFCNSENSYEQFANVGTDLTLYRLVTTVKLPAPKNLETASFGFIDEGRSEYIQSIASSRSPSIRSLQLSSFRGSMNNPNRLLCANQAASLSQLGFDNCDLNSGKSLGSTQFLNQVNRKLVHIARKKKSLPMYREKCAEMSRRNSQFNSHSQVLSSMSNETSCDVGNIYQEQYNDNISIFHNRSGRCRAPLASSESTTLSSSSENLICYNSTPTTHFRLFNPTKFPLINKLILSHRQMENKKNNNI